MGRRLMIATAGVAAVALAAPALAATPANTLHASLDGAQEVPSGSGDPNGIGEAEITLRRQQRKVCHDMTWDNIKPAKAGHIHRGPIGQDGPIEVVLFGGHKPTGSTGCTSGVSRALITELREHPRRFYVNIHNVPFPDGAIRGQLSQRPTL